MKVNVKDVKSYTKLGLYNLSAFVFGASLLACAYGNYQHAAHIQGAGYHLSVAASAVVTATGCLVIGKWLINKDVK